MQPPMPGPALMLPAIDLSSPPDLDHHIHYKEREARWKRLVSESHREWCLCGSYLNHFLPAGTKLLGCTDDGGDGGGEDGPKDTDAGAASGNGGEAPTDSDIMEQ